MTPRKKPEDKLQVGRPTTYDPAICDKVFKLCLLGAKDTELADILEISIATLNVWKTKHPELVESIKSGKEQADAEISHSLYHRAKGYSHKDVHISNYQGKITQTEIIKHYPPDSTAMIFWLKNRHPDKWRDRKEITGADGDPLVPEEQGILEAARRMLFILKGAKEEKH